MGRINFCLVLLTLLISGCTNSLEKLLSDRYNNEIRKLNGIYEEIYNKKELLNHLPSEIIDTAFTYLSSPPTCPPYYNCLKQAGDFFLVQDFDTLTSIESFDNIQFTKYSDPNNFVLRLSKLKGKLQSEVYNTFHVGEFPIPYFEEHDFRLGVDSIEFLVNGKIEKEFGYIIPEDLKVAVIESEAGDFWKENCNEIRPKALGEWKNGYSKGVAISHEENLIAYWLIVW